MDQFGDRGGMTGEQPATKQTLDNVPWTYKHTSMSFDCAARPQSYLDNLGTLISTITEGS